MKLASAIERPDLSLATKVEYAVGPDGEGNYLKFHLPGAMMIIVKVPDEGVVMGSRTVLAPRLPEGSIPSTSTNECG